MPGQPMAEEQKREKRQREPEQQNSIPVIGQTWWNKLLDKLLSWTLNRSLFLWMSYSKWIHILKKWLNCFFLFRNETRIFILNWN